MKLAAIQFIVKYDETRTNPGDLSDALADLLDTKGGTVVGFYGVDDHAA